MNPNKSPILNNRVDLDPSISLNEDHLKKVLVKTLKPIAVSRNRDELDMVELFYNYHKETVFTTYLE